MNGGQPREGADDEELEDEEEEYSWRERKRPTGSKQLGHKNGSNMLITLNRSPYLFVLAVPSTPTVRVRHSA